MILVVSLWVHPDQRDAYFAYERSAARIMSRHGGRIDRVIRPVADDRADPPFEIHLVSFPDEAALESYRSDPETVALAPARSAAILRTSVIAGVEIEPYR